MYDYKGYKVDPYTATVYTINGKQKQPTPAGRNKKYLKISIGRDSSSTLQRVIIGAYYGIDDLGQYQVHHIDKDPHNNVISNLLLVDNDMHKLLHKLDLSEYYITCFKYKKEEKQRLKEWGLL